MALAPAEPWHMVTVPFTPSSGAPPMLSGSTRFFNARKASFASVAPSFRTGPAVSSAFNQSIIEVARLSQDFSTTLPTNPLHTTTSSPL